MNVPKVTEPSPRTTLVMVYAAKTPKLSDRISWTFFIAKEEKVVKPPQNPVVRKSRILGVDHW